VDPRELSVAAAQGPNAAGDGKAAAPVKDAAPEPDIDRDPTPAGLADAFINLLGHVGSVARDRRDAGDDRQYRMVGSQPGIDLDVRLGSNRRLRRQRSFEPVLARLGRATDASERG
jgi:hypothetical protein